MLPTLLAAAGDTTAKEDLLKGRAVGGTTYKVHIDGYNLLPALKGEAAWPRKEFLYWTDDGSVAALRYDQWKVTFLRQNAHGLHVWIEPFEVLRAPTLANLRTDPFERAEYERPWATTAGSSSTCSCSLRPVPTSASGCRASRSSRRARSPAASTSTE